VSDCPRPHADAIDSASVLGVRAPCRTCTLLAEKSEFGQGRIATGSVKFSALAQKLWRAPGPMWSATVRDADAGVPVT
jgi:hypothetical protein